MKRIAMLLPAVLLLTLVGCGKAEEASNSAEGSAPDETGRYSGIGIYQSDGLWNQIEGAGGANEANAAVLGDDSQVIVVIDRETGEVRQCGNRSGFCIAMNPWKGEGRDRTPQLPAHVKKHFSDLADEGDADPGEVQNTAAPEPVKSSRKASAK